MPKSLIADKSGWKTYRKLARPHTMALFNHVKKPEAFCELHFLSGVSAQYAQCAPTVQSECLGMGRTFCQVSWNLFWSPLYCIDELQSNLVQGESGETF